jgi:adenosine kinase
LLWKFPKWKKKSNRARVVVITQGSNDTIVATNGVVTTYAVPPLAANLIVDANGAGDAFCGGFLSQLALGKSVKTCCDAGHYAARTILQVSGTVLSGAPSFVTAE